MFQTSRSDQVEVSAGEEEASASVQGLPSAQIRKMSPRSPPTEPAPSNDSTVAEQPPLPPGTPPPVEERGDAPAEGESEAAEGEQQGEKDDETAEGEEAEAKEKEAESAAPAGVHKGKEGWTAVWDPSSVPSRSAHAVRWLMADSITGPTPTTSTTRSPTKRPGAIRSKAAAARKAMRRLPPLLLLHLCRRTVVQISVASTRNWLSSTRRLVGR